MIIILLFKDNLIFNLKNAFHLILQIVCAKVDVHAIFSGSYKDQERIRKNVFIPSSQINLKVQTIAHFSKLSSGQNSIQSQNIP